MTSHLPPAPWLWSAALLSAALSPWIFAQELDPATELQHLRAQNTALRLHIQQLESQLQILRSAQAQTPTAPQPAPTPLIIDPLADAHHQTLIRSAHTDKNGATHLSLGPEPLKAHGSAGDFYLSLTAMLPAPPTAPLSLPPLTSGAPTPASSPSDQPPAPKLNFYLQTHQSSHTLDDHAPLVFALDGQPLELPIADHNIQTKKTGRAGRKRSNRYDQTLRIALDQTTLHQLSQAQNLTLTAGRITIHFDAQAIAAFRALERCTASLIPLQ